MARYPSWQIFAMNGAPPFIPIPKIISATNPRTYFIGPIYPSFYYVPISKYLIYLVQDLPGPPEKSLKNFGNLNTRVGLFLGK